MITLPYVLDMYPRIPQTVVHLSQYDSDFQLVFTLVSSHGTLEIQSGTTAEIRGTKTDGNGYSATAAIDINNKKVTVTGHNQMTAVAGRHKFELTLYRNNKEINTTNFIIEVEPTALDKDSITSDSVVRELIDVTDRADEIVAAAQTVEDALENLGFSDPNDDGNIIITMGGGS